MIRKTIFFLAVLLALFGGASLAQKSNLLELVSPIGVIRNSLTVELTDLQILDFVNAKREANGLKKLNLDSELTKSALVRLAVIETLGDWEGSISGMSREKAVLSTKYFPKTIGDIYLNSIEDLDKESVDSETLYLKDFTDLGIATAKSKTNPKIYLIFANRAKKIITPAKSSNVITTKANWGGPELWAVVNKRRTEFGVGQLSKKDELCTIASIRLNQLLELKKLDGHAGFQPVLDRSDLKWISEKYNISEYLAQGFGSAEETVKGWENTLGHRSLLTGGEFVWGCIYAQNSFAVAITAY